MEKRREPPTQTGPSQSDRVPVTAYDLRQLRGQVLDDNAGIWLSIEDAGDNTASLRLTAQQATHMVAFLVGLTQTATASRAPVSVPRQVHPIAIQGIGMAAGRVAGEGLLTLALGAMALTFAVSPSQMRGIAEHLHPSSYNGDDPPRQ